MITDLARQYGNVTQCLKQASTQPQGSLCNSNEKEIHQSSRFFSHEYSVQYHQTLSQFFVEFSQEFETFLMAIHKVK